MRLLVKNLLFTVIVPGGVAVLVPRKILERWPTSDGAVPWLLSAGGLVAVLAGASLYARRSPRSLSWAVGPLRPWTLRDTLS